MARKILTTASILALATFAVLGGLWAAKGNVDELRFGTAFDASGEVAAENATDNFAPKTTIYASMRVQEAVRGTEIMLSVLDRETEELAWSEKQETPGGHTKVKFKLSGLEPGKYRAKVKLGPDWVAEHEFEIESM